MKILITGAGRGGLSLAVHLQSREHHVTLVERDAAVAARASDEHGIATLVGEATDARTLRQADLARADAVLAMLTRDADNLAVAMLARDLGARRVLARMRDPDYRRLFEAAGARQVLSETEILVGAVATAVEFEAVQSSMLLGSGDAVAVELAIPDGAWVVGRTVSDLAGARAFPASCVVAGIHRAGSVHAPRGGTVLDAGAHVLLVASRSDLAAAVRFFLRRDA